jgi:hypothetical protein
MSHRSLENEPHSFRLKKFRLRRKTPIADRSGSYTVLL